MDHQIWRFRDDRYVRSPMWSSQHFTPASRCDDTRGWVDDVVTMDIRVQAVSQPDCYLVPGWFPHWRGEDVRHLNAWAMSRALLVVGVEVPVKPLVQFVGLRTDDPGPARRQVVELHRGAAAAYVHVSHIRASDSVLRLGHVFELLSEVEQHGPGGARVYWPAIGMTLSGPVSGRLTNIPRAAQLLDCSLACHRFRPLSTTTGSRAAEHSLRSRVDEAQTIAGLPRSMRLDRAFTMMTDRRDRLRQLNSVLSRASEPPLSEGQLATQIALLTDRSRNLGVA